ncbi:sensor histidine kinase [Schumannella soli]|uniref:Sensor histidine kinase n=1 Tax=Schumannella soli TaxID=2590779 RepID=A0A506XWQ2_9MICO|nr:ATP-binding protein [Schumannella soli]TPW74636.1 sensor histidine kinase [Schumannella soli]
MVFGVLATGTTSQSSRLRNRLRQEPSRRVQAKQVTTAIDSARELGVGINADFDYLREQMLNELIEDPRIHSALAAQLRQSFDKNIQQSHDFLQLAKLVRGHAEGLLREKSPDRPLSEAAQFAPTEGSIFYAAQLMIRKLDSLAFLEDPMRSRDDVDTFTFHSVFRTYTLIYQWQAREREITLKLDGGSWGTCTYNKNAIGAVLQGILDNLVKYAPPGSTAAMRLDERRDRVIASFTSLGPIILESERSAIFLPGVRGSAPIAASVDGQGIGLATAHQISETLGLKLSVTQSETADGKYRDYYSTTFSFEVELDAPPPTPRE